VKNPFAKHEDEYLEFDRIVVKRSNRPDLHAFLLLEELVPGKNGGDMVVSAEHDQIWLDVEPKKLFKVATEEQLIDLYRCGVMYDEETDSLCMFA
jgi:hypothetical protein